MLRAGADECTHFLASAFYQRLCKKRPKPRKGKLDRLFAAYRGL